MTFDWSRIQFTEHMTEAAAVVAECQIVLDFGTVEHVTYEIKVYEALKGGGDERYFAVGRSGEAGAFRPLGNGATAEAALQSCLYNAGVYHRRRVKQAADAPPGDDQGTPPQRR
jgi:hypothetical protein